MSRTKTFRVENNRTFFKCPLCQGKRMFSVPSGVRTRSLRCSKCGESTRCKFNRRLIPRDQQHGAVLLQTGDGWEFTADLADISPRGVGFDLGFRDANKVNVGRDISLKCSWNPGLFINSRYVVRSVKGQRVGVEKIG
jgi:PilZ domain